MEPAIDAIRTANTVLDFVWLPRTYRFLPNGNYRGKVIRMDDVAGRPTRHLLERRTKILQGEAVGAFDLAVWLSGQRSERECCRRSSDIGLRVLEDLPQHASGPQCRCSIRAI